MMELRSVIPNKVTNPTSEPSDRLPPVSSAAATPPTSAKGRLASTSHRLRRLPVTMDSSRMIPSPASTECISRSRRDWACASTVPENST
jgi:hypothetical protein